MIRRRLPAQLIALALALSSCRLFRPVDPTGAASPAVEAPASAPSDAMVPTAAAAPVPAPAHTVRIDRSKIRDANIAAMVLASNNTDISYAQLVPARAERADVKEFARRMLTDHTGVNAMINDLLVKLDLGAEDNEASLDMRDESAERRDVLRELSGYAFDSTYIENEVSYHRKFLTNIDDVMLPAARSDQLRQLLASVRPAVAAHLAHAEQVRANVLSRK